MEECDDGNTMPGDGCSDLCESENPPACTNGSDPWTNAPWVVCSSSPDMAWISSNTQGQYHPLAICQQLGYDTVGQTGGNCGNVCGYCQQGTSCMNLGNMQFDFGQWNGSANCGADANGPILCQTVHWTCVKN
jgi:cysteine-rich repeat protein